MKVRLRARAALTMATGLMTVVAMASACLPEVKGRPPKNAFEIRDVTTSDGMVLERACVPSGVEMCFDAYDNNCNGVIDEGCGLNTGVLQFTIAWPNADADVDLNVNGPDGDLAGFDRPSQSGLLKDKDCPGSNASCYGQNVENVFLAEGRPRRGRYRVVIRLEDPQESTPPIEVQLSARIGQRHFATKVTLEDKGEQREFEFTL